MLARKCIVLFSNIISDNWYVKSHKLKYYCTKAYQRSRGLKNPLNAGISSQVATGDECNMQLLMFASYFFSHVPLLAYIPLS